MDRTVRLWHVSRAECLCCFKHSDFVTSIQFHPRDDRFFLAGSLDSKLRLWSIPDKSVAFLATVRDMITSVAFTPDGKFAIAGCLNGLCILYETDGLKANSQVHVRSARGRNAKGSKITGIDTIANSNGDIKLLITSNDSRIRLYNFKDRSLEAKYRGNENSSSQIRASFSDDGKYIICGSEDRRTYIWPTGAVDKEGKRALEELETRTDIVTCAIMAPTSTKQLLGFSGDPLYDLCNPPPITLVSQLNSARSSKVSFHQKDQKAADSTPTATNATKGSPAYLARSAHPDGNIILAADYSGRIKVFRQDCAYNKRPSSSKLLGRSNSARHSIASSIGRESKTPSERILAWRSSVAGDELASINAPSNGSRNRTPSPRKSALRLRSRYSPVNSLPPKTESDYATPATHSVADEEPPAKIEITNVEDGSNSGSGSGSGYESEAEAVDDPSNDNINEEDKVAEIPGFIEGGQSNAFWTKSAEFVRNIRSGRMLHPNDAVSKRHSIDDDGSSGSNIGDLAIRRRSSAVSALSSDMASSVGSEDMAASATSREGEVLRCSRCRGTNFRATKMRGAQKLVCVRCNTVVR
jgi:WD repeat-containing protein 44